ncbi:flagellar basal-body protein [Azospirillum sp. ST 5-10]|uniref:flagellar basal-body protein n=1 Tax=unclassified Azospirillum TaxID=2630922 RepID=UPI003F4A14F6
MDKVDVRFPQAKTTKGAALPTTPEERAAALAGLMERLTAHLERETAAVQGRLSAAAVAALAKDKQPMVLVYEEVSRLMRIDPEGLRSLPPELKRRLRDANGALAASAAANAKALRVTNTAQQILVDTVVGAVNRSRQAQPGVAYGPAGPVKGYGPVARGYGPPAHGPATAATLNTRL